MTMIANELYGEIDQEAARVAGADLEVEPPRPASRATPPPDDTGERESRRPGGTPATFGALLDDPTFWFVATLGLGILAAAYASGALSGVGEDL